MRSCTEPHDARSWPSAVEWECFIKGPEDTPFEGGVFTATLTFPKDYPLNPPKMRFNPPLLHPNSASIHLQLEPPSSMSHTVYANGEVCISILHAPGDDPNHYETAAERWSPVQSVEKCARTLFVKSMVLMMAHRILLSVVSMLAGAFVMHFCRDVTLLIAHRTQHRVWRQYRRMRASIVSSSPLSEAHLCAQKMYRDNRKGYEAKVRQHVRQQLGL